jgi:hypothetical protein
VIDAFTNDEKETTTATIKYFIWHSFLQVSKHITLQISGRTTTFHFRHFISHGTLHLVVRRLARQRSCAHEENQRAFIACKNSRLIG